MSDDAAAGPRASPRRARGAEGLRGAGEGLEQGWCGPEGCEELAGSGEGLAGAAGRRGTQPLFGVSQAC